MKEMVGGCCVCSDDRGWTENPLVYCDGPSCNVAVHQACYGIVTVPVGNWYCRKCESQEKTNKQCELCPNKDGALKPTDNKAWAHVVCALYIPEVRFGNVTTMEPIILQQIPQERFNRTCYICNENSRTASHSTEGACMQCNKAGCRQTFHVTCAQAMGLLCEEAGNYMGNVKYCGYCHHHYTKIKRRGNVKVIPPYRPVGANNSPDGSPVKETEPVKTTSKRKLSSTSSSSGKNAASKSATPVEEISALENSFDSSKSLLAGSNNPDTMAIDDTSSTSLSSQITTNGNKRRKGARTPPVSNTIPSGGGVPPVSGTSPPDAAPSPRPITPLTINSTVNLSAMNSCLPVGGGNATGTVVTAPVTQNMVRPGSAASSAAFTTTNTDRPNSNNPIGNSSDKRQSLGVVKEVRPNSILVNVPLDAALMSNNSPNTSTANSSNNALNVPSTSSVVTSVSSVHNTQSGSALSPSPAAASTSSSSTTVEQPAAMSLPNQHQPVKRSSRSQSSEKNTSEKGRRSSKRSSGSTVGGGGSSSNNVPSLSPPLANTTAHNNPGPPQVNTKLDDNNHQSTPPPPPLTSAVLMNHHINNDSSNSSIGGSGTRGRRSNSSSSANTVIKEEKDIKIMQTAGLNAAHMLGNQLNPTSAMAQKMCDTLSQEMVAHSVFNSEPPTNQLIGPQPPRLNSGGGAGGQGGSGAAGMLSLTGHSSSGGGSGNNHGWAQSNMPQTLEQLLERQWEQGSQFLMEQAQHFDIASLLSCLHQLRAENHQLEEHVNSLLQRRDHLLAVNARLAIPLVSNAQPPNSADRNNTSGGGGGVTTNSTSAPTATSSSTPPAVPNPTNTAIVENGLPDSPRHDFLAAGGGASGGGAGPTSTNSSSIRSHRQVNNNSGGAQTQNNGPGSTGYQQTAQNSVLVRTTCVESGRRSSPAAQNVFSSTNNTNPMYSHNSVAQSQLAQQPQVVIRRDIIPPDLSHHSGGGGGGSSQPPTLIPAAQSRDAGSNSNATTGGGGGSGGSSQQQQPIVASRPS